MTTGKVIAERLYHASGDLWSVGTLLRRIGYDQEADQVEKVAMMVPTDLAARMEKYDSEVLMAPPV